MTFSHLNMTANERRRQEQSTALKRFQGFNAVITLSQLVGTILLFYSPHYAAQLYEVFTLSPLLCCLLHHSDPHSNT